TCTPSATLLQKSKAEQQNDACMGVRERRERERERDQLTEDSFISEVFHDEPYPGREYADQYVQVKEE
ncbi:MAG: hypothetical protein MJE68_13370, partial [Proteobacteria bacterium]|nr:hypothetical protein [Pseudomonadota bacterium]